MTLNKARSFLTTLGVIIGVAAVIVMMAVSNGAEAEVADQINAMGANLIMIQPAFGQGGVRQVAGPPPSLRYGDLATIEQNVTGISGVSAEQNTNREIKAGKVTLTDIPVVGTTPGFLAVREYGVAEGRFLTDEDNDKVNDVVVLGYGIAQDLFGDQDPIGQFIKIGTNKFTVVGVMAEKGAVGNTDYDNRVYVPIKVVFKRFVSSRFARDNLRVVYVSAQSKETMDSVKSQLNTLVTQILNTDPASPGFSLTTQDNIIQMRTSATETFRNLLAWVAGISSDRGWDRHHEHHAGQRHRAHARDRPAAGVGSAPARCPVPVFAGSRGFESDRRVVGRARRCGRLVSVQHLWLDADRIGVVVHPAGVWRRGSGGHLFRLLSGDQGRATRSRLRR